MSVRKRAKYKAREVKDYCKAVSQRCILKYILHVLFLLFLLIRSVLRSDVQIRRTRLRLLQSLLVFVQNIPDYTILAKMK